MDLFDQVTFVTDKSTTNGAQMGRVDPFDKPQTIKYFMVSLTYMNVAYA